MDVEVTKETLLFKNQGIVCIMASKGLQGTSGIGISKLLPSRNEIGEKARKIVHNSAVKIKATPRSEMNT